MRYVLEQEAVALLDRLGVIREGHFVGTSGRHLSTYVQKDVLTRNPQGLRTFAEGIAYVIGYRLIGINTIVAPPMGALGLGIMVAEELRVEYAYPEKVGSGQLEIKRSTFKEAVNRRRVGVVEDVFTTGKTTLETIAAVRAAGGQVIIVAGIYNRGGLTADDLGVEHFGALVNRKLSDWSPEECVLTGPCSQKAPIVTDIGSGAKFQAEHSDYSGGFIKLLG